MSEPDLTVDDFADVRPAIYLGDLFGPAGNAFAIRANLRAQVDECDDIPERLRRAWYETFIVDLRPLTYAEALDLIRERFEWLDDDLYDDIRFSARYRAERLKATGLDPDVLATLEADRKDAGLAPLPFEELCRLATSMAQALAN